MDINAARELLEDSMDFDYVESEGDDCIRFDLNDSSFWIYSSGTIGDLEHMPTILQKQIRSILATC